MKFVHIKKLVYINNNGGVSKTTIAYNTAVKFAEMGYKTVLIDADPQYNLSRLARRDFIKILILIERRVVLLSWMHYIRTHISHLYWIFFDIIIFVEMKNS